MVYQMLVALILNTNLTLFFFQMPYRVLDLGGTQEIASLLSMIHSITYVIATAIFGRKIPSPEKAQKNIKCILIVIIGIYTVTCLAGNYYLFFPLVVLHAVCVGIFWPVFWSGFNAGNEKSMAMSSSVIIINAVGALAPTMGGHLYNVLGDYLMFVSVSMLLAMICLKKPLMVFDRGLIRRGSTEGHQDFLVRRYVPEHAKPCNLEIYKSVTLFLLIWGSMFMCGYMEGVFRSTAGIFLLKQGYGAEVWGNLQSVKFLCTTGIVIVYRYFREEISVLFRMKGKWMLLGASFAAGSLLMLFTGQISLMFTGMCLLGLAYGGITFSSMYTGSQIVRNYGLNLGGLSECMLGIGILAGSFISGFSDRNPFFVMMLLGVIVVLLPLLIRKINQDDKVHEY